MQRVLITGGHLSPALAIVDELVTKKDCEIIFVGRKHAFVEKKSLSLEYRLMKKYRQVQFFEFESGRLTRGQYWRLPYEFWLLNKALYQAYKLLRTEEPTQIISFGSYLAFPICLAASWLKIPIYLHEQTVIPGATNRKLAKYAKIIFVSFPESVPYFPINKTVVSGIPLKDRLDKKQMPNWLKPTKKPLLLVLGGSTGSHSLNLLLEKNLAELTKKWQIVHQIGQNQFQDYERLSQHSTPDYYPRDFIIPEQIPYLYQQSKIVVSRSGANTFFELVYFKKPAVLIPLPWSASQEQQKQAAILEQAEVAKIFNQDSPNQQFLTAINEVYQHKSEYQANYIKLKKYADLVVKPEAILRQIFT